MTKSATNRMYGTTKAYVKRLRGKKTPSVTSFGPPNVNTCHVIAHNVKFYGKNNLPEHDAFRLAPSAGNASPLHPRIRSARKTAAP